MPTAPDPRAEGMDFVIVECANCNTRFRLADDRVSPKGTRVRCSRCATVFVVKPPDESAPALPELDEPSFDELPTRVAHVPSELLAKSRADDEATRVTPVPPELLAALQGPPPLPKPAQDPKPPFGDDLLDPLPQRPFGATSDGFTDVDFGNGLPTPHTAGPGGFADVDFGDGLPPAAPAPTLGSVPYDDPFALLGPPPGSSPFEDSWVPAVPPAPPSESGLELDSRAATQPLPAIPPSELTSPSGLDLDLSPSDPRAHHQPVAPQRRSESTPHPPATATPHRQQKRTTGASQRLQEKRSAPDRPQRSGLLRLASGVGVLCTALAAFVIARNDGALRFDGAAVARAFGLDEASAPDAASELRPGKVTMGHYPLAGGGEAFFVRGTVTNHARVARGPGIRVVAELRGADDRVIARAETWAGGTATPEQVFALRSARDWTALDSRIGAAWAGPLAPGAEAPFLIAFAPAPEAAASSRLRVLAMEGEPGGNAAPANAAAVNEP